MFVPITGGALAQQPTNQWEAPDRISITGNFSRFNSLVADSSGNLHAIWSEDSELSKESIRLDSIYYTTMDKSMWGNPIDIFAAHPGSTVEVMRLRIDERGYLHAMWISDTLFYAKVHVSEAMNVRAWQVTNLGEHVFGADMVLGDRGEEINIVYIIQRESVQHIRSFDGGVIWSSAVTVWKSTPDESAYDIRIEKNQDNILHAAWDIQTAARNWDPDRIMYARSIDGGKTWVDLHEVQEPSGQVSIGFDQEGGVHIFWNNPVWDDQGRLHILSRDGGGTWSQVKRIFPGFSGLAKWPVMAQDSTGTLHLVFAANSPSFSDPRIFHTIWLGDHWAEPEFVRYDFQRTEGPSLAISEGNQLHVLWFSYTAEDYGIWHTNTIIESPVTEFHSVPTLIVDAVQTKTTIPTTDPRSNQTTGTTPTPQKPPFAKEPVVKDHQTPLLFSIVVGILPVLVLVAVIIAFRTRS